MNHVALNRTRPDDGNLDHKIVKIARLQARQHVHLRTTLDLEHAERFPPAQHVEDRTVILVLGFDVRKLIAPSLVIIDQIETLPDTGQHAERQHIDLHHFQGIDVVLVPFDEGAVIHRGIADRHIGVETILRQHIAADMLRQMARELDQFGGKLDGAADHAVLRIETRLFDLDVADARAPAPPHSICERSGDIFGQTERLADIANGTARTIMNNSRHNRRPVTAIAAINILHHLFAARMLEIDIDIGRLKPLFRNEAFKQHIRLGGIHRCNAEHVANRRVGCRTAALTQDVLAAGIADDVMHRQEVMRVSKLLDKAEFFIDSAA